MAVHFVTGKLGGGKTLVSVGKIRDYLLAGKRVATNLDLQIENMLPPGFSKPFECFRIPDKPTAADLFAVGRGTNSKNDEDFGLIVLDELGTWLNSRDYQKDKQRQDVIDWFLHARKYGWDVFLIVQDPELIDKQIRISLSEHVVVCRRTDRIPLPIISTLIKLLTGKRLKLPRIHVGAVFYGSAGTGMKVDTWCYRGNHLFNCYDTNQVFLESPNRLSQYLPLSFLKTVPLAKRTKVFYMRLTKIYFKKYKIPSVFMAGLLFNVVLLFLFSLYNSHSDVISNPTGESKVAAGGLPPADPATPEQKKTHFVAVSHSFVGAKGDSEVYYFYDNQMFTVENSPYKIIWKNSRPYAEVEILEEDEKQVIF